MPVRPPQLRPPGYRPGTQVRKEYDARRGSAAERGYNHRWAKASATFRKRHPLCRYCEIEDRVSATALVDHLYPHRVHDGVFWVSMWWVPCCTDCHSIMKQGVERQGVVAIDQLARRLGVPTLAEWRAEAATVAL